LTPEDGPLARAINVLADLAFYAGIGRKTTQGMGMARRLELDEL
jgi:CRISPR-associated endoribonuclease Cas6